MSKCQTIYREEYECRWNEILWIFIIKYCESWCAMYQNCTYHYFARVFSLLNSEDESLALATSHPISLEFARTSCSEEWEMLCLGWVLDFLLCWSSGLRHFFSNPFIWTIHQSMVSQFTGQTHSISKSKFLLAITGLLIEVVDNLLRRRGKFSSRSSIHLIERSLHHY